MKNIKSFLAATVLAVGFAGSAQAAETLAGASAPTGTTVGGSIVKYINFTKTDNLINLGDLGGPMFGNGGQKFFKSGPSEGNASGSIDFSSASVFPSGTKYNPLGTAPAGTVGNTDGSEIIWDANTHVGLTVAYGKLLRTDVANHDGKTATADDTLVTRWVTTVAGTKVEIGKVSDEYNTPGGQAQIVPMAVEGATATGTTRYVISPSVTNTQKPTVEYKFDHGSNSGIKLDVIAKRMGVDDHYGQYSASVDLTFADLN